MTSRITICIVLGFAIVTGSAVAQTVTGSGTNGSVPVFTGSSTIGNSVITLSGSNVGIGTASPPSAFTVNSGGANYNPSTTYGSAAAWALQTSGVELAAGVDSSYPYAYWLQARQATANQAWPITLNPVGGNVGIGTTAPGAKLEVNGNLRLTSGSGASVTYADGTQQTTAWTGVLCGGDYAEAVNASGNNKSYEPGDVLVLASDTNGNVEESHEPYSTMVAGIYATKPGVIGRRQSLVKDADELPMAMVGIVPTKVTAENGPIRQGDLLVTSSQMGFAMKGTERSRMLGAVIGKAMGSLESGKGLIEVLVTLQ